MPYIFGKLWHLAIIWAIRKAFQSILQGVRILPANHTRLSPTSDNESYINVLFWKIIFMETYYSWSLPLSYFADFTLYVLCCYKLLKTLFVVHIDAPPYEVWALTRPGDRKGAPAHNWLLLNISPLDTTGRHHDHHNHHHHPLLHHQHYHHHHNLFVNLVSLC